MSGRPKFDDAALTGVLAPVPAAFSRERRIALLLEAGSALVAGKTPSPEAAVFLGAGLVAWLAEGGDLCRDYWKVTGPAGSHRTASWLARQVSSGGGQGEDGYGTIDAKEKRS